MTTRNDKGRAPARDAAPKTTRRNDTDMSTAAQRKRVLALLMASPQTTYSLRARGISHPAQRVKDLIKQGFLIESHRVTAIDSDGFSHAGVARYVYSGATRDPEDTADSNAPHNPTSRTGSTTCTATRSPHRRAVSPSRV
jgi:hypothetical protein